jgi:hypothetical protein
MEAECKMLGWARTEADTKGLPALLHAAARPVAPFPMSADWCMERLNLHESQQAHQEFGHVAVRCEQQLLPSTHGLASSCHPCAAELEQKQGLPGGLS